MLDLSLLSYKNPLLACGDSALLIHDLPDNSIDLIFGDPPYLLSFMGKHWDSAKDNIAVNVDFWRECLRVLKPGGYMLMFGGTRTAHRMVSAIEDAGFQIRDSHKTPTWIYSTGFPKSLDLSKFFDKMAGHLETQSQGFSAAGDDGREAVLKQDLSFRSDYGYKYEPVSEEAKKYQGVGSSLKPAWEPLCLARKPLSEKNLASNVLKWGTGGINIDAARVGAEQVENGRAGRGVQRSGTIANEGGDLHETERTTVTGRWPSNVWLSPADAADMDNQSGVTRAGKPQEKRGAGGLWKPSEDSLPCGPSYGDEGGASRFFHVVDFGPGENDYLDALWSEISLLFYVAKPGQAERNAGLDHLEGQAGGSNAAGYTADVAGGNNRNRIVKNFHPTVKPKKLAELLCALFCPPSGIILDPFMGSGTTGCGAAQADKDYRFIGFEREIEYHQIAEGRIAHEIKQVTAKRAKTQLALFEF